MLQDSQTEEYPNLRLANKLLTNPGLLAAMLAQMIHGSEIYGGYYTKEDPLDDASQELVDTSNYVSIELAKTSLGTARFHRLRIILQNTASLYEQLQNVRNNS